MTTPTVRQIMLENEGTFLSITSICKRAKLKKAEVEMILATFGTKISARFDGAISYYAYINRDEGRVAERNVKRQFREMTPESYKKHILRGVVSI